MVVIIDLYKRCWIRTVVGFMRAAAYNLCDLFPFLSNTSLSYVDAWLLQKDDIFCHLSPPAGPEAEFINVQFR